MHHVGDVMFDATMFAAGQAGRRSTILSDMSLTSGNYAVATIHRAENTDDPQQLSAVVGLSQVLRNAIAARVCRCIREPKQAARRLGIDLDGLKVIPPVGYLDMTKIGERRQRNIYGLRRVAEGSLFSSGALYDLARRGRNGPKPSAMAGTGFGEVRPTECAGKSTNTAMAGQPFRLRNF